MSITSNIDDVLMDSTTKAPSPAPKQEIEPQDVPHGTSDYDDNEINEPSDYSNTVGDDHPLGMDDLGESHPAPMEANHDDYGNPIAPPKTYTEDQVNERINAAVRDRLARMERNQQPTQQQAQQAAQGFQYNENSQETWQQQLESFVEQTVSKMSQRQVQQSHQQREAQAQAEFEGRFQNGMAKFSDYADVVRSQPITDHMVLAARSMKDPAAFFYAASKRAPQELERISRIPDQYAQIAEIAKLEERMKQAKPATKAPKPLDRTPGDSSVAKVGNKEMSIEQMIAADAKRRLALQARRRG